MAEGRKMPGGNAIRRAVRVTTGTAVAATEVMVMSFEVTRRVSGKARRMLPLPKRGPNSTDDPDA